MRINRLVYIIFDSMNLCAKLCETLWLNRSKYSAKFRKKNHNQNFNIYVNKNSRPFRYF
jgi:hypothetical protein